MSQIKKSMTMHFQSESGDAWIDIVFKEETAMLQESDGAPPPKRGIDVALEEQKAET